MSIRDRSTVQSSVVTAEELLMMSEGPGLQFEIDEGKLIEVPGAGLAHHLIVMAIVRLLDAFVTEHDLGYVLPDGMAYLLSREPDTLRIPDVSFIHRDVLADVSDLEGYWHGAPDLAVEVVSPNDNAYELHDKVQQYLEAGVAIVWVVWPSRRSVSVHFEDSRSIEILEHGDLEGQEVLPGFSTPVSVIFDQALSAVSDRESAGEEEK